MVWERDVYRGRDETIRRIAEDPWRTTQGGVCGARLDHGQPKLATFPKSLQQMEEHGVIWLPLPTSEPSLAHDGVPWTGSGGLSRSSSGVGGPQQCRGPGLGRTFPAVSSLAQYTYLRLRTWGYEKVTIYGCRVLTGRIPLKPVLNGNLQHLQNSPDMWFHMGPLIPDHRLLFFAFHPQRAQRI